MHGLKVVLRPTWLLLTGTVIVATGSLWPAATEGAGGSIDVQVIVDGLDRSGGSFSVVILPAGYPQPVVSEEVEEFSYRTQGGRVRAEGLEPGKYLVAIVLANSLLKESAPASVEVAAPEWVRNSSGVTSGFWPAYEVEISADRPDVSVTL